MELHSFLNEKHAEAIRVREVAGEPSTWETTKIGLDIETVVDGKIAAHLKDGSVVRLSDVGMAVGNLDRITKLCLDGGIETVNGEPVPEKKKVYTPEQADAMGFLHEFWDKEPDLNDGPGPNSKLRGPWFNVELSIADLDFRVAPHAEARNLTHRWECFIQWAGKSYNIRTGSTLKECCEAVVECLDSAIYHDMPESWGYEETEEAAEEVVTQMIGTGHMGSRGFGRGR
jgi:hypothetical protein